MPACFIHLGFIKSPSWVEDNARSWKSEMKTLIQIFDNERVICSVVSHSWRSHQLCSPRGSFVYEILQARILAWVAIPFFRGSSRSRDRSQVSSIAGGFFTIWAPREASGLQSTGNLRLLSGATYWSHSILIQNSKIWIFLSIQPTLWKTIDAFSISLVWSLGLHVC